MNKDINFKYIEDFVEYIVDRVEKDEELLLTVVGKFEEIKTILKDVMLFEFINFESLQIESPIMDNYNSEFIFSIWMNDGILEIGCEKLKNENGEYDNPCGDETYLLGNASSKIIPLCEGSDLYFVNIEEYDEECNECCECDCHKDDSCVEYSKTNDGELHGFTASKSTDSGYHSYSFYTSDNLSKSDIRDILKQFGF